MLSNGVKTVCLVECYKGSWNTVRHPEVVTEIKRKQNISEPYWTNIHRYVLQWGDFRDFVLWLFFGSYGNYLEIKGVKIGEERFGRTRVTRVQCKSIEDVRAVPFKYITGAGKAQSENVGKITTCMYKRKHPTIGTIKRQSTASAQLSAYAHWLQTHRQTP